MSLMSAIKGCFKQKRVEISSKCQIRRWRSDRCWQCVSCSRRGHRKCLVAQCDSACWRNKKLS